VFGYAGDADWCAHRCRLSRACCIPIDKAMTLGLDVKYTGGKKAVNTGVIISTISNTVRDDAQKWLMLEKSILADAEWRPTYPPGDQETFDYIFRASQNTKDLPDVYNYRGFHAVSKLEIVSGELRKRSGARVFVPHASGPGKLPDRIVALSRGMELTSGSEKKYALKTSVIIPAWGTAAFVGRCLDSIALQTKLPDEVLVGVDGCDNTLAAIKSYIPKDLKSKIRLFWFPKNVGCYVVRNTLAELANGMILLFFDADDVMCPDYVETMLAKSKPGSIVRGKCNVILSDKVIEYNKHACQWSNSLVF